MKKIVFFLTLLALIFPCNVKAIETSATSAILMDIDSDRVLYAKDIHRVRSVASISKIMTAIVAIENADIKSNVTIGEEISKAYGSAIYIKIGEVMTLEDLLYGLMLRSGNDAALAIANYAGGSVEHFVEMMNEKAKEIGMIESTFNNPSGLDEDKGNYSSAYDMAILTSYAMQNETYKKIVGTTKYTLKTNKNVYSWTNKHRLLTGYEYTTGGKTGFTEIARRTLVTTASKNNTNLVVVTLNDGNDFQDHKNLFEYGFENYQSYQVLKKGTIQIYDDDYYSKYNLYVKNNFSYLLENGENDSVILDFQLEKNRNIHNNDKVGNVNVKLGDKTIHTEDIFVATKETIKQSWWDKIKGWLS